MRGDGARVVARVRMHQPVPLTTVGDVVTDVRGPGVRIVLGDLVVSAGGEGVVGREPILGGGGMGQPGMPQALGHEGDLLRPESAGHDHVGILGPSFAHECTPGRRREHPRVGLEGRLLTVAVEVPAGAQMSIHIMNGPELVVLVVGEERVSAGRMGAEDLDPVIVGHVVAQLADMPVRVVVLHLDLDPHPVGRGGGTGR